MNSLYVLGALLAPFVIAALILSAIGLEADRRRRHPRYRCKRCGASEITARDMRCPRSPCPMELV